MLRDDVFLSESTTELAEALLNPRPCVPTGLSRIDRALWSWGNMKGIPRGEYVVVAGASNSGKTQLSLRLTMNAAEVGEHAYIISLDMRRLDILHKLHQAASNGELSGRDWSPDGFASAAKRNVELLHRNARERKLKMAGSLSCSDRHSSVLDDIMLTMEELKDAGVTWFMIDHLQKIQVRGLRANQMTDRVEIIGEAFADFSFRHEVTICALSQLTAQASRNFQQSPTMYDCYGGTGVMANATLGLLCDHTLVEVVKDNPALQMTWIWFSKNRMGPKGHKVPVMWNHPKIEVRQAAPGEDSVWPTHDKGE